MRTTTPTLLLTLALAASVTACARPAASDPGALAIVDVTVLPMDGGGRLEHQTVVVRGRRIETLGPSDAVEVPPAARVVDGRGRFLLPGLAEMHGHLPGPRELARYGDGYLDRILWLNLANGITTVRGMLGSDEHLIARAEIAGGERLGPQLFVAGPSINGDSVPDRVAAWRTVTEQRAAGFDLLKIHPGVPLDAFDAVVSTARREGIPFAGHIPQAVGLRHALDSGIASVEHLDGYLETLAPRPQAAPGAFFFGFHLVDDVDTSRIPDIVTQTCRAGVWNTPTEMLFENLFGDESPDELAARPEMAYVPRSMVDAWKSRAGQRFGQTATFTPERGRRFLAVRHELIRALAKADCGLLLGADAPQIFNVPGFATIRELEKLVAIGLTPREALASGTRNPARYFGLAGSFGVVAPGARADLLLLEADPLAAIGNVRRIAGVVAAGSWLGREELDRKLAELAESAVDL